MARRLAAILAADVVGYSRLMGADEAGTLAALRAHREELFEPKVAAHDGRIVKLMGDGVLAEFPSAVEAVLCAVEIQRGLAARNAGVPEEQRIQFRIGVNLGDVISEDDDIFGDGINIAARLEELAEPGGICLSSTVHLQVRNKVDVGFKDLGKKNLKNIAYRVHVFSVTLDSETMPALQTSKVWRRHPAVLFAGILLVPIVLVAGAYVGWLKLQIPDMEPASVQRMALPLPDRPSIAVLPFSNISGDPEQDYFADGMTEDIITGLSHFKDLFVVARNSVFTYKGKPVKVQVVSEELGVRYVLEGSVRKAGNKIRVTAQLVDAVAGHHIWAKKFDRELTEIFSLQDEITQEIVAATGAIGGGRGALQQAELERISRKPTESLQAYDFFLRGVSHIDRLTKEDNLEARRLFQKAIDLDPSYAGAYGQLAWTHLVDVYMDYSESPELSLKTARRLAEQAVAVDSSDPKSHWALATVNHFEQKDDRAIAEYQEAIEFNPNDADILSEYGNILAMAGRPEDGLQHIKKAMRLNPYHPEWYSWNLGTAYFASGQYEDVIAVLSPLTIDALQIYALLAASYAHLNQSDNAQAEIVKMQRIEPNISLNRPELGYRTMINRQDYIDGLRKAGLPE